MVKDLLQKYWDSRSKQMDLTASGNIMFPEINKLHNLSLDSNAALYTRHNRFYPGCTIINEIEDYGETMALNFLNLQKEYDCCIQLLSGTQANQCVYNAMLEPRDTVLAVASLSGGHESHIKFIKKYFNLVEYSMDTEYIDYDHFNEMIRNYKPKLVIAGSALYPKEINYSKIYSACIENNALFLADISHTALYIATGHHNEIYNSADFITLTSHKTTRGARTAILYYRKKFHNKIQKSLSGLTQCASRISDIISNTVMFEELNKMDKKSYVEKSILLSNEFIANAGKHGILSWTNDSDTHLAVLLFPELINSKTSMQNLLENINILCNDCKILKNNGLRFGFLYAAAMQISNLDFKLVCEIIFNTIKTGSSDGKAEIIKLAEKYNKVVDNYVQL